MAAAALAAAPAAHAQVFTSAYAPRAGERAEITIDKCRVTIRNGARSETCGRSIYLEEMLSVSPGGGRMRYTLQSIEPVGGPAMAPDVERILRNFNLLLTVDESGFPTNLENIDGMMGHVRSMVANEGADAQRVFDTMFERMDGPGAARLFTRDWAGVSLFQAIEAEVGKPLTGAVAMPFPVDPSLRIDATATLLVESIDRRARRAHMSYRQVIDEASARPVIAAFVRRMMASSSASPPANMAERIAAMRLARSDEWRAIVDINSGRVVEMRSTADALIEIGGESRQTIDTITLNRRMLA